MPPILPQSMLNNVAQQVLDTLHSRIEAVTFNLKATAGAQAIAHTLGTVAVEDFRAQEIDAVEILHTDQRFRVATSAVTFVPTRWSTITRADGSVWQIMRISGGSGHPFWLFQGRQIG